MALYLQMDGVDDKLVIPAMTVTEFVLDLRPRPQVFEQYINFAGKQINRNGSNNADQINASYSAVYVDSVQVTNNTAFIKVNTRQILRGVLSASSGLGSSLYWNGATSYMEGDLYSLSIYNGATLMAQYDFALGHVQDISGNNRHATLTGGTWLDDGVGGGGTVQTGTASLSSVTTIASSGIPIRSSNGTVNGLSVFSSDAIPIRTSNSTILGYGTLTANSSVGSQILANAILNGSSLVDSNGLLISTLSSLINTTSQLDINGIGLVNAQGNSIGNSSTSAIANLIANANSSILGNSIVSVSVGSQSLASAILQSTTNVSANGLKQIIGNSQINGLSSTSFNGVRIILSDSGIIVDSDLQANATRLIVADSQLNGSSGLLSDSIRLINLESDINVHSAMTVFVGDKYYQVIPIAIDIKRNELIVTNIHRGELFEISIKRKSVLQVKI